ncbi:MAG: glycosyltransferase, partial [Phycisphaerae bacterium]|nr:glycosyltransferase [Phycisphaerae bacterium]
YNGTTTTCEAMAMGVPTVTLVGDRHAGRVGLTIMTNAGLPELVARDEAQYIEIARTLALDTARLRSLRGELRGRMQSSVLCDAPAFGRRFSDAVATLWARACERHERAGRER